MSRSDHFFSLPLDSPWSKLLTSFLWLTRSYISLLTGIFGFALDPLLSFLKPRTRLLLSQLWHSAQNLPVAFCFVQSKNQSPYVDLQGPMYCLSLPLTLPLSSVLSIFLSIPAIGLPPGPRITILTLNAGPLNVLFCLPGMLFPQIPSYSQ